MRAVNVKPSDGDEALDEMKRKGAHLITSSEILELAGSSANAS